VALTTALVMLPRPTHGRVVAAMCAAAAVALVGFSQLEPTAHYPTDLLAGWLGATAWVIFVGSRRAEE